MRRFFYGSMVLAMTMSLQLCAEVVNLPEAPGECPDMEIPYLSGLQQHVVMEGKAYIKEGWESDKYWFKPGTAGLVKIHYKASQPLSVKIDYKCGGSDVYRKADGAALPEGSVEIPVTPEQSIHIGTWDWYSGAGYPYDLDVEFIPENDSGMNSGNTTSEGGTTDGGGTNETSSEIPDIVVYEDAEDANTDGWQNVAPYTGSIANIPAANGRVILLSGTTNPEKNRASYSFGKNWNNTKDFIAKWDMMNDSTENYEIFFVGKSTDDPNIVNYIGYVGQIPTLAGYRFDKASGYWIENSTGEPQYDWGRYTYIPLGDQAEMTTITRDLKADAMNEAGIDLAAVDSMWVNVYGDDTAKLVLDNIMLQKTAETQTAQNHVPIAQDQNLTVREDQNLSVTLTATDADGDTLTYTVVSQPSYGTLSGTAPNLVYIPDSVEANTTDSFTFKASDDQNDFNFATVTITIVPQPAVENQPPVVGDMNVTTNQNSSVEIRLNAIDPEGADVNYRITQEPQHGSLSVDSPKVTYSPDTNFTGTDSFAYVANDGENNSTEATVTITVNAVENNTTEPETEKIDVDENSSVDVNCAGQLIDMPQANQTLEIHGTLSGQWDNDHYSFVVPENSTANLKVTAVDNEGNPLKVQVIRNCFVPISGTNGIYPVGGSDCHLISVVVYGCTKEGDVPYTLTLTTE